MNSLHIKGGRVIDPASGRNEVADLLVLNGSIAAITPAGAQDGGVPDRRNISGFLDRERRLDVRGAPGGASTSALASGNLGAKRAAAMQRGRTAASRKPPQAAETTRSSRLP